MFSPCLRRLPKIRLNANNIRKNRCVVRAIVLSERRTVLLFALCLTQISMKIFILCNNFFLLISYTLNYFSANNFLFTPVQLRIRLRLLVEMLINVLTNNITDKKFNHFRILASNDQ